MSFYHQNERDEAANIGCFVLFGAFVALVILIIGTLR